MKIEVYLCADGYGSIKRLNEEKIVKAKQTNM